MNASIKLPLVTFGVFSFPWLMSLFFKHYFARAKRRLELSRTKDYYYHVIFTSIKNVSCRVHLNIRKECSETCSYVYLEKIVKFLSSAKHSISVCIFTISLESVLEELIAATSKRGVEVRVITDWEMTTNKQNIYQMCKNNKFIKIKTQNEKEMSMMHHKFCLVDEDQEDSAKVFFGSLNLTIQGLCGNYEHVLFTNDKQIVKRFSDEFNYLWKNLESI